MAVPYTEIFLGLLLAYMVYSAWARLDGRYPIGAALVLLVAAAVTDAAGATSAANTLAIFVFFLLAAGVILLLVEHIREGRSPGPDASLPGEEAVAQAPVAEAAQPGELAADEPLDHLEGKPVPPVDAPRDEGHEDE